MKLKRALLIMFAMTLMTPVLASCTKPTEKNTAKVYYVDSEAGSDEANGLSEQTAWKTLRRLKQETIKPGETIKFKGEFNGDVLAIKGSGELNNRITITSYGGNRAVFDSRGQETTVYLNNQSHINIDNIEIKNTAQFYDVSTNRTKRNGIKITADSGIVGNITVKNSYIHDVHGTVVWNFGHHDNSGINIRYNKISDANNKFDNILIEDCLIEDIRGSGARIGDLSPGPLDAHINPYSSNIVFRRLIIRRTGADGIIMQSCDSPLIDRVELYDAGYHGIFSPTSDPYEGTYSIAGLWACGSISPVVQYSIVARTRLFIYDAQPFNTDWGVTGTAVFQYNLSYDNEGGPLLRFTEPNTIFRYNISINDDSKRKGGAFHHIAQWVDGVTSPGGILEAYNNIFYDDTEKPYHLMNDFAGALDNRKDLYGKDVFRNNIFMLKTTYSKTYSAHNIYDNNLYYDFKGTNILAPSSDLNAIKANPLFNATLPLSTEEIPANAFYLKPGSPAIGAGITMQNNGGIDFYGKAIKGATNIGVSQSVAE